MSEVKKEEKVSEKTNEFKDYIIKNIDLHEYGRNEIELAVKIK
jgi:hypothetical protein